MGLVRNFAGGLFACAIAVVFYASPALAFNFEADCEGIIISYTSLEDAASRMDGLGSATTSQYERDSIVAEVNENTISRYFQKNIAEMTSSDLDAVGERFTTCIENWPGRFPLTTPKADVLSSVQAGLHAIREITKKAAARRKQLISEEMAAADLSKSEFQRQSAEEEALIEELNRKIEKAEAVRKRAEDLSKKRRELEERLAQTEAGTAPEISANSGMEKDVQPLDTQIEKDTNARAETDLAVISAYFQQYAIAQLCSDADVNFATSDLDNIQTKISALIAEKGVERTRANAIWSDVSRAINSNSSKLTQADCDQAHQWFTYSLPDLKLGTPSDFPFD